MNVPPSFLYWVLHLNLKKALHQIKPIERALENLGIETSGVRTNTKTGYNFGGNKREIITPHDVYQVTSVYAIKKEIESKSKMLSKGTFSYDGVEYRVII